MLKKPQTNHRKIEKEKRIPEEAYTYISDRVVELFERDFVGRDILAGETVPEDQELYKYYREYGSMINAQVIAKGADFPQEGTLPREEIKDSIRKFGLQYKIPREDWLKDNWFNRNVRRTTYQVAKKIESTIFYGDSDYNIKGIDDVAFHTVTADEEWEDTGSGEGTPWSDIKEAVSEMQEQSDNQLEVQFGKDPGDLALIINPIQWNELFNWHQEEPYTNGDGGRHSREMVTDYVGRVIRTESVEEGHGFVGMVGQDYGRFVVAEDLTTEEPEYQVKNQSFLGNIFARGLPVFPQYGDTSGETLSWVKLEGL